MKKLNIALAGLAAMGVLGALPVVAFQAHDRRVERSELSQPQNQGDEQEDENASGATSGATSVPEPATIALLTLGLAGVGLARRRNK